MMKHSGYQRNGWLSKFFSCSTRNGIVPLEMETVLFLLHSLFFKLPKWTFPVNHTKCTFSHGQLTLLQRPSLHSPTKCSWNLVNFRVFDCLNQSSFITVIECHWVQWILLLIQQELRPEPSNRGEYKHFMHFKFKHKSRNSHFSQILCFWIDFGPTVSNYSGTRAHRRKHIVSELRAFNTWKWSKQADVLQDKCDLIEKISHVAHCFQWKKLKIMKDKALVSTAYWN